MRVSLEELIESVREREPDPAYADVPDPVLVESFTREAAQIAASTCRWLLMLAEIVRRGVWAEDAMISPAAWLSWRAGMAASTAREHVRVALALADFPVATARFAAGELSYSKVRAIVSTGRPELDELLVQFAACAAGQQLQRICRSFVTADGPTMDPWAARDANLRELPSGMSEIRIVGPTAEVEAAWNTMCRRAEELHREEYGALKAAAAAAGDAAAADEPGGSGDAAAAVPARPEPIGARRADAAFEAFAGLDRQLGADTMGRDRHLVVLHTREDALSEPTAGQDRLITVAEDSGRTPTLSARVLRRLACSGVRRVVHDADGDVVAVRDERRYPTTRQRRLLWLRDRGCRFPSCDRTRNLHAHHIVHWEDGGPTELENLVLLCGTHHRFVHDQGWTIATDGGGRFAFAPPGELPVPVAVPLPVATIPDAVFPEWPEEFPHHEDPSLVFPHNPLAPVAAQARPDDNECLAVLMYELQRLQPPETEDIVVAA